MTQIALFYSTFPDREKAEEICRQLIEEKLLGCANIFKAHQAFYPWAGKIEASEEVGALLKTSVGQAQALLARLQALHPYEVPCILSLEAVANDGYAAWINHNTLSIS